MFLDLDASRILGIGLVLLSLSFPPDIFGGEVSKRVIFPKGKNSVSYKGKLPRNFADYDPYYFPAKKSIVLTRRG
jgi:hypothetical protein